MINKVINTIIKNKLIDKGDKIVLGLSGGADSICLFSILYLLKDIYNITIFPVHINHMLREKESIRDECFIEEFLNDFDVKYSVFRCNISEISKNQKISIEEAGRITRYKYFNQVLDNINGNKISVAHNMNDQAETMIMRFMRGTGLKGLSGINYKNKNIIRPLLDCPRSEIEYYLKQNKINYINDSSNLSTDYTRNKIRINLIPYIEENFNPNIVNNLSKISNLFLEDENYLETITNDCFNDIVIIEDKIIIDVLKLKPIHISIKRRIIRKALLVFQNSLKDISNIHITDIINLLYLDGNKQINLPNNLIVYKQYNNLILSKNINCKMEFSYDLYFGCFLYIKEIKKYISINTSKINLSNMYTNVYTKIYSYDTIKNVINLRSRQPGDKIFLEKLNGYKKIKDIFIDDKIPISIRNLIPLLVCGNDVIWILDKHNRESSLYKINSNTITFFYVQIWEEKDEKQT